MVRDSYVRKQLQRMRDRMEVRGLKPITVTVYLRCLRRFIMHVGKPLGSATTRDIEQYLLEPSRPPHVSLPMTAKGSSAWGGIWPARQ